MVKCPRCDKTVYANEAVKVAGGDWHSGCVRCRECQCSLNVKSAVAHVGDVYCKVHIPKPKATTVADDVMSQHAKQAQATKTHAREDKGSAGAIHSDMRKGDNAEVHAAHGVAKAAAPPTSYGGGGGDESYEQAAVEPEPEASYEQPPEQNYEEAEQPQDDGYN